MQPRMISLRMRQAPFEIEPELSERKGTYSKQQPGFSLYRFTNIHYIYL
jgi:hypothetical protein